MSQPINSMYGDGIEFGIICPFLTRMRSTFLNHLDGKQKIELDKRVEKDSFNRVCTHSIIEMTDEEFFSRYLDAETDIGDIDDLAEALEGRVYGCNMYSTLAHKIINMDYGLSITLI